MIPISLYWISQDQEQQLPPIFKGVPHQSGLMSKNNKIFDAAGDNIILFSI